MVEAVRDKNVDGLIAKAGGNRRVAPWEGISFAAEPRSVCGHPYVDRVQRISSLYLNK